MIRRLISFAPLKLAYGAALSTWFEVIARSRPIRSLRNLITAQPFLGYAQGTHSLRNGKQRPVTCGFSIEKERKLNDDFSQDQTIKSAIKRTSYRTACYVSTRIRLRIAWLNFEIHAHAYSYRNRFKLPSAS